MVQQSLCSKDHTRSVLEGEELVRWKSHRLDALWYAKGIPACTSSHEPSVLTASLFGSFQEHSSYCSLNA